MNVGTYFQNIISPVSQSQPPIWPCLSTPVHTTQGMSYCRSTKSTCPLIPNESSEHLFTSICLHPYTYSDCKCCVLRSNLSHWEVHRDTLSYHRKHSLGPAGVTETSLPYSSSSHFFPRTLTSYIRINPLNTQHIPLSAPPINIR